MQAKQKFFHVVGGAVLGVVILLIGMAVSPTTAQKSTFGEITCTGLTVVDQDGNERVRLNAHTSGGGTIYVIHKVGMCVIKGNTVGLLAKPDGMRGKTESATMTIDEDGPSVGISTNAAEAGMGVSEDGGLVVIYGEDGKLKASMSSNEHGGIVNVCGKDGKSLASMKAGKYGGLVSAYGNEGEGRSAMGVNRYGNGAVATWDKHGEKRGDLK